MTYKKGEIVKNFINWILQVVVGGTIIYNLWEGKTHPVSVRPALGLEYRRKIGKLRRNL